MFQIGDRVVYGVHGVCSIVEEETRIVDRREVVYIVLEPIAQGSARFLVPTHNAAAMAKIKNILTRQELDSLLRSETVRQDAWIREENLRKQTYRELISSGNREGMIQMLHTLYIHKATQNAAGKKCHLCDENFLRDAEKVLAGEISVVLGVDGEAAKTYLREHLNLK